MVTMQCNEMTFVVGLGQTHDIPFSVAVNEAVELSKIYCSEEAKSFINGILGKLGD